MRPTDLVAGEENEMARLNFLVGASLFAFNPKARAVARKTVGERYQGQVTGCFTRGDYLFAVTRQAGCVDARIICVGRVSMSYSGTEPAERSARIIF